MSKIPLIFVFATVAFASDVPIPGDDNPVKPPFKNEWFSQGKPIPPNKAGELILTAYPSSTGEVNGMSYSEWIENSSLQKLFGLPPEGLANPLEQTKEGGYVFVKNGFHGESSVSGKIKTTPTRCTSDKSESKPRINCLNFSLQAKQPFQIAVTVYDQVGNFVTQYRETVSEKEFRNIVQGPNYAEGSGIEKIVHSNDCVAPASHNYGEPDVSTINGLVKVNVNIYPFGADGRPFSNGVYILKIAKVDLPYEGCINSNGTAVKTTEPFVRNHSELKMGWMNSAKILKGF